MAARVRIPPLPSVADVLKLYHLRARKQLAQNFLLSEKIINRLVNQVGKIEGAHVLEVGPGPGGLTRSIIRKRPSRLVVIEKDPRFKPSLDLLSETLGIIGGKMEIMYDDIMRTNLKKVFPQELHRDWDDPRNPRAFIIGNLPFNVSTPLIIRWLEMISRRTGPWALGRVKMCLTFQKEVAERLIAEPHFDQRCRLSVMAQAWTTPKLCFTIPGSAFVPKPNVDVGVVLFEPLLTVEEIHRLCSAYKYIIEKHPEVKDYNYRASKKVVASSLTKSVYIRELKEEEEISPDNFVPPGNSSLRTIEQG
ncbi:hypothetical protein G9C98_007934 [Cotesia typhae]|uniref:rRNA adenine N(6)-methyltransferase n=1 Tax=Cotesia typhae TaxID=2053667 RepID=A0A8J5QJZ2_9HYME|nr:hypothetical protein G9C98_007934 [Cotesia typhae]